jgi:hypothetical protein
MPHTASVTRLYAVLRAAKKSAVDARPVEGIPSPELPLLWYMDFDAVENALALKHNHKADPQFPTTKKTGRTL